MSRQRGRPPDAQVPGHEDPAPCSTTDLENRLGTKVPPQGVEAKNVRFAMIPESVIYDPRLTPLDVRVYGVLVRHADAQGECYPGEDRIGELVHATSRAVRNSIRRLSAGGHIEVVRRGRMLTNLYRVTGTNRPVTQGVTGTNRPSDRNETTKVTGTYVPPNENQKNENQKNEKPIRALSSAEKGDEVDVTVDGDFVKDDHGVVVGVATTEMQVLTSSSNKPVAYSTDFERFWLTYPRKQAKPTAYKAWQRAIGRASPAEIIDGAMRYSTDPNLPEPSYIPHPATWLNGDRWNDPPEPDRRSGTKHARTRTRIAEVAEWMGQGNRLGVVDAKEVGA